MDDVTTGELKRTLDRIETKLDTTTLDHELRIRKLERALWIAMGSATVLGGGAGAGLAKLIGA